MIAIIAMLAAIVSVAVVRGLDTAKQTRIKTELDQLDAAFKAYKEKYGAYPPCDLRVPATNAALRQHIARAFPRYNLNELALDLSAAGIDPMPMNFRPDQALVFWLRGFSSDPLHPFVTLNDNPITMGTPDTTQKVKRTPLFDFDTTRLVSRLPVPGDTMPSYFPAGVNVSSTPSTSGGSPFAVWSGGGAPYLYWDAPSYGTRPMAMPPTEAVPTLFNTASVLLYANAGVAVPYWLDANQNGLTAATADFDMNNPPQPTEKWVNPESFQIIATGLDGRYGAVGVMNVRCYPTGGGYDTSADLADDDNLTNFCAKARLGDAKP